MLASLHKTFVDPTAITQWNEQFAQATPQDVLLWAGQQWGSQLALSCSFGGPAGMVLLDMVMEVAPTTSILAIDTGLLFPETYAVIEQAQQRYNIVLQPVQPRQSVAEQAQHEGEALWERDPNRCCSLRKVQPMAEALAPFGAWITGIRRENSATRASTPLIEWSSKYNLVKLNPLVAWSERDVWRYIHAHNVPYNSLLDRGYRSLGCAPCTQMPVSDDPRSGRWIGFNKTECGLHI